MFIDFRSDTVTQPTKKMREAMLNAEVGDDVYGDDPTMNKFEDLAAKMLGKEAAMFVASGTMGNQLSIMTHTRRGNEIIAGENNHVIAHEVGAAAVLSGVFIRTVKLEKDRPDVNIIEKAIREENIHYPDTGLICLEEPTATGRLVDVEDIKNVYEMAHRHNIPVHLDGARLFNACAALNVSPADITKYCDSVMICISKGLCAPVGSVIAGSKEFIARARKNRKMLGGGMRQAGFLAAAGIIALEEMTLRVHEDNENAKYLGELLKDIPCIDVNMDDIQINMVFCTINVSEEKKASLEGELLKRGIKINPEEDGLFRFVTTNDTSREDIEKLASSLKEILA